MFGKSKTEKYVIFSPMEGMLMQNGQPLPNTKIIRRLRWNGNDDGLVQEFSSDDQGRFSLPIYEEDLSLSMLSQFVAKADLEIETETETETETDSEDSYLWSSSKFYPEIYTETDGPMSELVCDIEAEEIPVPMGPTAILTKCRWKNMPK